MVEVLLSAALICFPVHGERQCHPALIGNRTYPGEYQLIQRLTDQPGYGGDVLQYDEGDTSIFAIHRVWTLKPEQKREHRLSSGDPKQRKGITAGCVNVAPAVYDALVSCCHSSRLVIK